MREKLRRNGPIVGVIAVLTVLALAIIVRYGFNQQKLGQGPSGRPPTPVVVTAIEEREFADILEAIGTARANESVTITAKVTDTISGLQFDDGQTVMVGDILAELTDVEESAKLDEARAGLAEARKQYDRIKGLVERGSSTQSRLDQTYGAYQQAGARVSAIEATLADRIIRAPFAGVLGLRQVSPGTLVKPGDAITTLDDISLIKVDFSVPERYISELASQQTVAAQSDAYPDRVFSGIVATIDSRVDPVTRSIAVRAEIPNSDGLLRSGMLLTINLVTNRTRSLTLPEAALIPVREQVFVYVVTEEGVSERRLVEVGRRKRGVIEALSGVSVGEKVVIEGTHRIFAPGQKLNVIEERDLPKLNDEISG